MYQTSNNYPAASGTYACRTGETALAVHLRVRDTGVGGFFLNHLIIQESTQNEAGRTIICVHSFQKYVPKKSRSPGDSRYGPVAVEKQQG